MIHVNFTISDRVIRITKRAIKIGTPLFLIMWLLGGLTPIGLISPLCRFVWCGWPDNDERANGIAGVIEFAIGTSIEAKRDLKPAAKAFFKRYDLLNLTADQWFSTRSKCPDRPDNPDGPKATLQDCAFTTTFPVNDPKVITVGFSKIYAYYPEIASVMLEIARKPCKHVPTLEEMAEEEKREEIRASQGEASKGHKELIAWLRTLRTRLKCDVPLKDRKREKVKIMIGPGYGKSGLMTMRGPFDILVDRED